MTDVEQQAPPQNGIDLSAADDDDSSKARPADIEQDMREMERRKRVEAIMGSKLFREELERIVDSARDGGGILQQLSDIMGVPTSTRVGNVFKATNCMLPINDIRGVESMGYAKGEKILRCKLAATFRLLDLYGWTQGLGAQITARLKVDQENFLVNPYGMMYHEITASSLNKVDMQGQIVEQGTTNFGVNKTHFALHSVVHAARPDIRCAIYIGCTSVVAVSSLKVGLLPVTRDACVLGEITTHTYTGTQMDSDERDRLVRGLGPNSKVLILSNYGALCCGETIEEAFFAASHIVKACETQLQLLPVGVDNLVLIPEESRKTIYIEARRPPEDLEKKFAAAVATVEAANAETAASGAEGAGAAVAAKSAVAGGAAPKWRVGGAEFEALMRMLDNAGYRTGYIYRHPLIKSDPPKPRNDVELPPAVSSLGYLLEEEELLKQGIWKKGDFRKGGDRSRWLNSPNVYQKVEVLETGTPDPKKITKWVAESSPTHSTPVRIEDALQFVPPGTNPKEFKRLQQQIKDNRRADKISAGPQSHILEGVTWDEANRIKDATVSSAGDHVVLMGAASKGIIQRGYQHNAAVYKAPYAKNPFDNVTDDELNEYKRTVERKKKSIHGEYTDTDFSESEPLSSMPISAPQQTKQTTITTAAVSQSEPEEVSEHQVMRIQTQQAPIPSQPEVVLSDATSYQNHTLLAAKTSTQIHKNYNHHLQSYKTFSTQKYSILLNNFEKYGRLAQKYAFLYNSTATQKRHEFVIFNVWMIHKIEIFPHYTYPLPADRCPERKLYTNQEKGVTELDEVEEDSVEKLDILELCEARTITEKAASHNKYQSDTAKSTTTTTPQPYRTCSHYGFNYPITYQPNIPIHPANLLTAVQLQREKVIAFIKSTAMSLNTSYFSQQQKQNQIDCERQPRAPRLKPCEIVAQPPSSTCTHNVTAQNDKIPNTDSNGSYISVKEIKLEHAKYRSRSKSANDRDCCDSLVSDDQHFLEHEPALTRQLELQQRSTEQHDSLSEHFSSLLSIGGTSYPPESHSHNDDLAHDHEEEDHENGGSNQHQHYDDSGDNTSSIYTHTTPTTQRASYMLRDFLPAHAQATQEMPEHKPESEQDLVQEPKKRGGIKLLATPCANKSSPDDGYSDDGMHTPPLPPTHQSHKQIKLTLNSNTTRLKRRCSSHSSQEAAVNIALSPPERYHQSLVTASLSETDSLSATASSSLRSLEIHININVKNSDCARTLQTHEDEFRRKLERIIDDEINLIAQQLSEGVQYVSSNHMDIGSGGGVYFESKSSAATASNSKHKSSPRHHLHAHKLPHMETLNDLRLTAGEQMCNKYGRCKFSKSTYIPPESQHQNDKQQQRHPSTQSPLPARPASATSCSTTANNSIPSLNEHHRQTLIILERELENLLNGIICANALHNHAVMCDCKMKVAQISQELRASLCANK